MSETTLTVVTFEPDWMAVYIDDDLYRDAHDYQEADILRDLIESDTEIDTVNTFWLNPSTWRGVPDSPAEAKEMYGDEP